ncbi:MAG: hypothetical protein JWR30_2956 [Conexibacter sp.]|nr:hypothetical protein [Conexibacter sp.]
MALLRVVVAGSGAVGGDDGGGSSRLGPLRSPRAVGSGRGGPVWRGGAAVFGPTLGGVGASWRVGLLGAVGPRWSGPPWVARAPRAGVGLFGAVGPRRSGPTLGRADASGWVGLLGAVGSRCSGPPSAAGRLGPGRPVRGRPGSANRPTRRTEGHGVARGPVYGRHPSAHRPTLPRAPAETASAGAPTYLPVIAPVQRPRRASVRVGRPQVVPHELCHIAHRGTECSGT